MFNQVMAGVCFIELRTVIRFFRNISGNELDNKDAELCGESRVCGGFCGLIVAYFQGV